MIRSRQPHQQRVHQSAVVGGHRPHRRRDAHRHQRGGDAQDELRPRAVQQLAQDVAPQRVRAQGMPPGRRRRMVELVESVPRHRVVHVGRPHGRHEYGMREGHQREYGDDRKPQSTEEMSVSAC